jgi:hypothetical protein
MARVEDAISHYTSFVFITKYFIFSLVFNRTEYGSNVICGQLPGISELRTRKSQKKTRKT